MMGKVILVDLQNRECLGLLDFLKQLIKVLRVHPGLY